jgi:hypothetical protein
VNLLNTTGCPIYSDFVYDFFTFCLILIFVVLILHLCTEGMNEDGSFIGQYGRQQRKQGETSSGGFATLV